MYFMRKLRILIISNNYPPYHDGISVYTNNLFTMLSKNGNDVKLLNFDKKVSLDALRPVDFFYNPATKNKYYSISNILNPINILNNNKGLRNFVFTNMVYRVCKSVIADYKPDVIHVTYPRLFSAVTDTQIPVIFTAHSEEIINTYPVRSMIEKSNAIICVSEYTEKLIHKIDNALVKKTYVIHNSIDFSKYSSSNQIKHRKDYFIGIGRLSKEKNFDNTIKAFSLLPDDIKTKYKYIIIGGGSEQKHLQKLINELNLNNSVKLLGNIAEEEKITLLKQSKYFLLCPRIKKSEQEGFGIAFLEAQAAGLPIITSSIGGIKEAVGDAGLYIDNPENSNLIAKTIEKLLNSNNLTNKLKINAKNRISQFVHKYYLKKVEELYKQQNNINN